MPPRVTADLLLVGSVPATSTEEALRAGAQLLRRSGLRAARRRDRAALVLGRVRAGAPGPAESGDRDGGRDDLADRGSAAHVRVAGLRPEARRVRRDLGFLAPDRRRDLLVAGVPAAARRGGHPGRAPVPDRAAVPGQRAERAARRLRGRVPGRVSRLRRPGRARDRAADGGDPAGGSGDPVGHRLRDPRHRGGAAVGGRRRLGAVRRGGRHAAASGPRRGARRVSPVLRDVPRVADVRGAGHVRPGADGQLRPRRVRAADGLGAHGRAAVPAQ